MCFTNDYDWYATIYEDPYETSNGEIHCDECYRKILADEKYRRIYGQEREEDEPDEDGNYDIGEFFDYNRCKECNQIFLAIRVSEVEEGCRQHESQPNRTELRDALSGEPHKYLGEIKELFPDFPREHLLRLCSEKIVAQYWDMPESGGHDDPV